MPLASVHGLAGEPPRSAFFIMAGAKNHSSRVTCCSISVKLSTSYAIPRFRHLFQIAPRPSPATNQFLKLRIVADGIPFPSVFEIAHADAVVRGINRTGAR